MIFLDNLKELIITETNKNITHSGWNLLVDHEINYEVLLKSIIGDKYKGLYSPLKEYAKYDYVIIDNKLCIIDNLNNGFSFNYDLKNIKSNPVYSNNYLYYIDNNENIMKVINNAYFKVCDTKVDNFKINDKEEIVAKKGSRFYKIIENKLIPINITFGDEIENYFIDNNYIYFISEGLIRFGEIYNNDNTYFNEIEIEKIPMIISASNNNIFIITSDNKLITIDKLNYNQKIYDIFSYELNKKKANIIPLNDNFISIYDGKNNISGYKISDNNIYKISSKNFSNIEEVNFTSKYLSLKEEKNISVINNIPFNYKEINPNYVLLKNSTIFPNEYNIMIDFEKSQIINSNFVPSINTGNIIENKYLEINNGNVIKYENFSNIFINKSIILDLIIEDSFSSNEIGHIVENNKKIKILNNNSNGNIKIAINVFDSKYETFVYKDNEFINCFELNAESISSNNEFLINSPNLKIKQIIIFNNLLSKEILDYYCKNKISSYSTHLNNSTPFSYIKSNESGNTIIQTGTNNIKGILNISDELSSPNKYTAFSTNGAKKLNDKILEIEEIIDSSFSNKDHKHYFKEILEVPSGNESQKGIVYLTNEITDDSSKAATISSVKRTYDLANHKHPYLNLNTGGIVNGNTNIINLSSDDANIKNITINKEDVTNSTIKNATISKANITNGIFNNLETKTLKLNGYTITVE